MKHDVTVTVHNGKENTKVLKIKEVNLRERILTLLFGTKSKVVVISPYESVNEITIKEKGGSSNAGQRNVSFNCE